MESFDAYKPLDEDPNPAPVLMAKTQLQTALVNQIEIFHETRRPIPNMEVSLGRGPLILVSISSSDTEVPSLVEGRKRSLW